VSQSTSSQDVNREVLLASVSDLQGSIHALDSKSSAALVVHGLLAAAIATAVGRSLDAIERNVVRADAEVLVLVLVSMAATAFLLSVFAFLRVLRPRSGGRDDLQQAHVFHPTPQRRGTPKTAREDALAKYLALLEKGPDFERDLAAEVLKLRDLLKYQAEWAASGVRFLMIEVGLVAALAAAIATSALGVSACPWGYVTVGATALFAFVAGRAQTPLDGRRSTPEATSEPAEIRSGRDVGETE
jgi:hypothetical protein